MLRNGTHIDPDYLVKKMYLGALRNVDQHATNLRFR